VVYLSTFTLGLSIFFFCSFWVYHYIDLERVATRAEKPKHLVAEEKRLQHWAMAGQEAVRSIDE
jgi:hypothetical protein